MLKKYLSVGIATLGFVALSLGAGAMPTQAAYVTPGVSVTISSGMSSHPHHRHHRHQVQVCKTHWHHHHKVIVCEWVWKYW